MSKQFKVSLVAALIVIAVVLAVLFILVLPFLSSYFPHRPSDSARTRHVIGKVHMFVDRLMTEKEHGRQIFEDSSQEKNAINSILAERYVELVGSAALQMLKRTCTSEFLFCDAWGQPLRMALMDDNVAIVRGVHGMALGNGKVLLVWSVGRNGVDENLGGDDFSCRAGLIPTPSQRLWLFQPPPVTQPAAAPHPGSTHVRILTLEPVVHVRGFPNRISERAEAFCSAECLE